MNPEKQDEKRPNGLQVVPIKRTFACIEEVLFRDWARGLNERQIATIHGVRREQVEAAIRRYWHGEERKAA